MSWQWASATCIQQHTNKIKYIFKIYGHLHRWDPSIAGTAQLRLTHLLSDLTGLGAANILHVALLSVFRTKQNCATLPSLQVVLSPTKDMLRWLCMVSSLTYMSTTDWSTDFSWCPSVIFLFLFVLKVTASWISTICAMNAPEKVSKKFTNHSFTLAVKWCSKSRIWTISSFYKIRSNFLKQ